jgi:hypothetical protein
MTIRDGSLRQSIAATYADAASKTNATGQPNADESSQLLDISQGRGIGRLDALI